MARPSSVNPTRTSASTTPGITSTRSQGFSIRSTIPAAFLATHRALSGSPTPTNAPATPTRARTRSKGSSIRSTISSARRKGSITRALSPTSPTLLNEEHEERKTPSILMETRTSSTHPSRSKPSRPSNLKSLTIPPTAAKTSANKHKILPRRSRREPKNSNTTGRSDKIS